ncbi:CsbD family protein [Zhongshania sp.]|jgi:uncharacterized protein YjbJ (UPF0337 family)|uniref:CsbD family protein n=1 Tax=Zhongshania sp. TaxID=1971902 RepID=UPI001B446746|nr:CsbD family protein [Zhongshania sp.]MBQ0795411.1 CsbD family protein [Zhongshania sp.]
MNRDQAEGRWREFTAKVKQEWGDLTDDEVLQAEGNIDAIAAKIQQKYGDSKQSVAEKLNQLMENFEK